MKTQKSLQWLNTISRKQILNCSNFRHLKKTRVTYLAVFLSQKKSWRTVGGEQRINHRPCANQANIIYTICAESRDVIIVETLTYFEVKRFMETRYYSIISLDRMCALNAVQNLQQLLNAQLSWSKRHSACPSSQSSGHFRNENNRNLRAVDQYKVKK